MMVKSCETAAIISCRDGLICLCLFIALKRPLGRISRIQCMIFLRRCGSAQSPARYGVKLLIGYFALCHNSVDSVAGWM